mmetsp:Transcript_34040/g.57206  ORF Transcript_34040/g.57206 Transcript_34040/m.57206 type:complete len:205 (-) Transcript_34040:130-744(-)
MRYTRYSPARADSCGEMPMNSRDGVATNHIAVIGISPHVTMHRPRCITSPTSMKYPAPNACPASVFVAPDKPTMTEFPVTLLIVVASAAAASSSGPSRPTKATDTAAMNRLHSIPKQTGAAKRMWKITSLTWFTGKATSPEWDPSSPSSSISRGSQSRKEVSPLLRKLRERITGSRSNQPHQTPLAGKVCLMKRPQPALHLSSY